MKHDHKSLIKKEEALECLFSAWKPKRETEEISIWDGAGRVLSRDMHARFDLPPVRASFMDGIAVRSADFRDGIPDTSGWVYGTDYVRADTGDDFDDAFDAVIAIEDVTVSEDGKISLAPSVTVSPGSMVKAGGSDLRQGDLLVSGGTRLGAKEMAAIVMGGHERIPVVKRPIVSFLPTGSELISAGSMIARGQNFDSNSILVRQMLIDMGAEPMIYPISSDDRESIESALSDMIKHSDVILLNAGSSKGSEDYCTALLLERGQILFKGVAAVPGRPMSAAVIDGKPVINLSGPPAAAFYGMDWMVSQIVCRHLGIKVPERRRIRAILTRDVQMPPPFSMMLKFSLKLSKEGKWLATPMFLRGPGAFDIASSLTAEAAYFSAPGEASHTAGDSIELEIL